MNSKASDTYTVQHCLWHALRASTELHPFNRPFSSCLVPLFQSESWCIAFHMKMSFHSHADKTHFHMKSFARGLALKKRHKTIRKWPIGSNAACNGSVVGQNKIKMKYSQG